MPGKGEQPKNYVELTEDQIFEKIKEDLNPIKEDLTEKRMTIEDAKDELKKINEWIQGTKLEHEKKKEIGNTFDSLINNLEANFERNNLETEFNEVVKLVETLTKKDLANLNREVQQNNKQRRIPSERKPGVQEGIDEASDNLRKLSEQEDINFVADWARKKIGELGEFFS